MAASEGSPNSVSIYVPNVGEPGSVGESLREDSASCGVPLDDRPRLEPGAGEPDVETADAREQAYDDRPVVEDRLVARYVVVGELIGNAPLLGVGAIIVR